jgi:hypothetical protein
MAMKSKSEDNWANDESLQTKKFPGRPRKIQSQDIKNVQLRLPQNIIDQIDELIEGKDMSRHAWLLRTVKAAIK